MKRLNLVQGTPAWHEHRAMALNASDAPAMLGLSKYKSRSALIAERATGIAPEVDAATQRRFDDGHRFEALARPLAEKIIGEELSPVTGTNGELSASFDGLPFDNSIPFEHKSLNEELRAILSRPGAVGADLPEHYQVQMEHQLMVCEGEKVLFMASSWTDNDELIEELHCWYYPNPELRARIVAGWEQFKKDVAAYVPATVKEMPKAEVTIDLPALFVHAKGEITTHNMDEFGTALTAKLAEVRSIVLVNDQDFSNAKESAKKFRETAKAIALSKEQMLAQTETIGEAARKMDAWVKDLNATALQLEKDVEREDKAKKEAMVNAAALAFRAHVEELEAETRPVPLILPRPDFASAIKGKRNYASMQDAVDTMLAQAKSGADAAAKDVRAKLAWCKENAAGHSALFPDLQQIISKPMDDFTLTITSRIEKAKADDAAKLEAERERIRQEEEAKARSKMEAEAKAKAEAEAAAKLAEEEARIRAEERAKTQAEAVALANREQLAAQERAESANTNTSERKAVTHDGAQPAAASRTEPAAPATGKAIHIAKAKTRPTDDEIIDALAMHFRVHESKVIEWLLDMDLKAASERMENEFA